MVAAVDGGVAAVDRVPPAVAESRLGGWQGTAVMPAASSRAARRPGGRERGGGAGRAASLDAQVRAARRGPPPGSVAKPALPGEDRATRRPRNPGWPRAKGPGSGVDRPRKTVRGLRSPKCQTTAGHRHAGSAMPSRPAAAPRRSASERTIAGRKRAPWSVGLRSSKSSASGRRRVLDPGGKGGAKKAPVVDSNRGQRRTRGNGPIRCPLVAGTGRPPSSPDVRTAATRDPSRSRSCQPAGFRGGKVDAQTHLF